MAKPGKIRAGMGGWTFEPWDTSFYPEKLPKTKQLEYASRAVPTIEVNGTYYSGFKEPTFLKWASEAPDGFVYSLKGNRFVTNRKVLAEAGESVQRFVTQGITALGEKLGPLLWQFAPTKKFEPDDFEAFLKLLPEKQDGIALQHALEVRNKSFAVPEFVALARKYNAAIVYADHAPTRPSPTSPAISSTPACRPAATTTPTATTRSASTNGRRGQRPGPRERCPPTCRAPTKRPTRR